MAALAELERGRERLRTLAPSSLSELVAQLRRALFAASDGWVADSVRSKGWQHLAEAEAEEWASGPLAVARFLAHVAAMEASPAPHRTADAADGCRSYRLPGIAGLADGVLLRGYHCELHVSDTPTAADPSPAGIAVVLGAGNITATPVLDALEQILLRRRPTALKLHPVHAVLQPTFERALAPLLEHGWLRLLHGDAELGRELARDPRVAAVHLTGSDRTWQALRNDERLRGKELTAEVGCATPALIVPGSYRDHELRHVARQLAAHCANNGGATCVAPRVVLTDRSWPQRQRLLQLLGDELAKRAARRPFLPGVREAYEQATGRASPDELPPTLQPDAIPDRCDHECFAPILREIALPSLAAMTAFARNGCFGSLSAYVFASPRVLAAVRPEVERAICDLPHGTVALNCWPGLGYGLGTTPWGVPRSAPVAHGRGFVRDTSGLGEVRRCVLRAPFRPRPLPPWLPFHRGSLATLRAFTRHTLRPSPLRLIGTALHALRSI